MKTKELVVCLIVLLFGISAAVVAEEIPGGILYSDGGDAIYQDFATGGKVNLTVDFEPLVTGPVTISEDGTLLAFASNSGVFVKQLPNGTPFLVGERRQVKRLSISPHGYFIAVETTREVEVIPVRSSYIRNNWRINNIEARSFSDCSFPVWRRKDSLLDDLSESERKSNRLIEIIQQHREQLTQQILEDTSVSNEGVIQLGGTSLRLPTNPPLEIRVNYGPTSYSKEFLSQNRDNLAQILRVHEIVVIEPRAERQEVALFDEKAEVIYRYAVGERGRWENLRAKTRLRGKMGCQGVTIKPDGTITYLSGSSVYSEKDDVLAEGIRGSNIQWVNSSNFLFRGNDGSLYLWKNGEAKKLLGDIPEQFCYTPVPVSVGSGTFTISWQGTFFFGDLQLYWHWPYSSAGVRIPRVPWAEKIQIQISELREPLEYTFIETMDLRTDFDPLQYNYSIFTPKYIDPRQIVFSPDTPESIKTRLRESRPTTPLKLDFPLDKTLIIKQGREYISITIINAGFLPVFVDKYYHALGEKTDSRGRFINVYYLPLDCPQLTFEWRYWRE